MTMIKEPVKKEVKLSIKHKIGVVYEHVVASRACRVFCVLSALPLLFLLNPRSLPLLSNHLPTPPAELTSYLSCPL